MPGKLDKSLEEEWLVWRLVLEGATTLTELETHWSLDDMLRANALLDMRADIEKVMSLKERRR